LARTFKPTSPLWVESRRKWEGAKKEGEEVREESKEEREGERTGGVAKMNSWRGVESQQIAASLIHKGD
jgi:hypothetical protein